MQTIRSVNPNAQLVQTEDLGKVYSTPKLAHQAEFENHRRWLSFDLLCGRVTPSHAMLYTAFSVAVAVRSCPALIVPFPATLMKYW